MSAPDSGYALVRRPEILEEAYSLSPLAEGRVRIEELCAFFDPKNYRGIERYPLNADMPYIEPGWQWTEIKPNDRDEKARDRVREIIGPITWQDLDEWLISNPWLIPSLDHIDVFCRNPKISKRLRSQSFLRTQRIGRSDTMLVIGRGGISQ